MRAVFFIFAMTSFLSFGQELVVNGGSDVLMYGVDNKIVVTGEHSETTVLRSKGAEITKTTDGFILSTTNKQVAISVSYYERGKEVTLGYYVYNVE